MTSKIGDTVYTFDMNRRVYDRDEMGRSYGGPIYREHWRPWLIVGEEKRSWLVAYTEGGRSLKMAKGLFKTEAQVDDACWVDVHRYRLSEAVRHCHDVALLREIATLIGYKPEN